VKYLTLIRTVALLHQHSVPCSPSITRREDRVHQATLEDIAIANRLAGEVLGARSMSLRAQTRRS